MGLRVTYKSQTLKPLNASPHNRTWRRAEGKQKVNRKGTRVQKWRWQSSPVQHNDSVVNHPFQTFPGSIAWSVQNGFLTKWASLEDVRNWTSESKAGCRDTLEYVAHSHQLVLSRAWTVEVSRGVLSWEDRPSGGVCPRSLGEVALGDRDALKQVSAQLEVKTRDVEETLRDSNRWIRFRSMYY